MGGFLRLSLLMPSLYLLEANYGAASVSYRTLAREWSITTISVQHMEWHYV
jgi:hypothetical protein